MTPSTTVPPAVTHVAQPNNLASHPNLISFLMNHAVQNELERKQQQFHEQQKSYVSALVGMLFGFLTHTHTQK